MRNEFKSWGGVNATIFHNNTTSHVEVRRRLFEFMEAQGRAIARGDAWQSAAAPCHSRRYAMDLYREVCAKFGKDKIAIFTGETDQYEKQQAFKDATATMSDIRLVIYTPTLSVGVSINVERMTDSFAFFIGGNCGSQQSVQMIFRPRQLKRLTIAYTGRAVRGMPQTSGALMKWATLAANRWVIPSGFRGDANPIIMEQTQEDPESLHRVIAGSFEGQSWMINQLEHCRSARWFVGKVARALEGAGVAVSLVDMTGKLDQRAKILDVPARVLAEIYNNCNDTHARVDNERSIVAAEQYPAALESGGHDDEDDSRLLTADEIQGRRALFAEKNYIYGEEAAQLKDLDVEGRAEWIRYHGDPRRMEAYSRLKDIVGQRDQAKGPALTGGAQTATTSQAEAAALVTKVFACLGASDCLQNGDIAEIDIRKLREPDRALVSVMTEINAHCLRVFGDTHGARRRRAISEDGPSLKQATGTLGIALSHVGATLHPTYDTPRDAVLRKPGGYAICWDYERMALQQSAPEPIPAHPA